MNTSSSFCVDNPLAVNIDNLQLHEEWNNLDHLLSATPFENADPRASVFQKIDLNQIHDSELFQVI